jgi:hypothetical protein
VGAPVRLDRIGPRVIPLHSHSCATRTGNPHGITLLYKKVGGGSRPLSDPFVIVMDRAMIGVP